jgi:5'-nucleotidase
MKILISNDDGILARGLNILATTLAEIATVEVVAPDRNRSASSNSLTVTRPLRVRHLENGQYSVEGTPTDCVHLALTGFLSEAVDMVVSGINEGGNLGDDVLYSGTVAAAMEGRFLGFPAIAVSLLSSSEPFMHYQTAATIVARLILKLNKMPLPAQTIFNINVPNLPLEQIKGLQVTRLGTRHCAEAVIKDSDPRGRPIYWIGPPGPEADAGPGTDFYAVNAGYVSITPLHLDLTHYKILDSLSAWLREGE